MSSTPRRAKKKTAVIGRFLPECQVLWIFAKDLPLWRKLGWITIVTEDELDRQAIEDERVRLETFWQRALKKKNRG